MGMAISFPSMHDINKSYRTLVTLRAGIISGDSSVVISLQTAPWPIGFIIFNEAGRMNS
jgi:hypothetical protein